MQMTEHGISGVSTNERALPRDVRAAINYMRRNIGKQLRLDDLLEATGARERSLRKHFSRFLGLAPISFFLRLRLAAARDALLVPSTDSVSEVAARFGFVHFGRFASDYRRCFGEPPSATRRRVTQAEPVPPRTIPMPYLSVTMPTLVIVPFQTQGDRENNALAEGLREVISIELARGRGLSIRLAPSDHALATLAPGRTLLPGWPGDACRWPSTGYSASGRCRASTSHLGRHASTGRRTTSWLYRIWSPLVFFMRFSHGSLAI